MKKAALAFVLMLGIVSLFSDMAYEGARSITGPYLEVLGASAAVVGIVAGLGELIGYGFRLVSGYITDRTRRYWAITIFGYAINLLAIPALALAGNWTMAAVLIIIERFGKAIRSPAKDVILSHPASQIGRGWGFGLHEALDQLGAISGPLIVAGVLLYRGSYRDSFALLLLPAMLAVIVLLIGRAKYPSPGQFEKKAFAGIGTKGFPRSFWIYLVAVSLVAAAYSDFALVSFHFQKNSIIAPDLIPVYYAIAMGADAIAALLFGRIFDRAGIPVLAASALVSACFAPLVFLGGSGMALMGMIAWGIGLGAQESIMRAAVADLTPPDRRGTAYGLFNIGYGIFWFLGSALMGVMYDINILYVVAFSVIMQLASVPIFLRIGRVES